MKVKSIPSSWISRDGLRLDCNPYMSGALEARIRLEELPCRKDVLASLCSNGINGIYHAGRESRSWVDDPDLGVPFLSSSSILAADLSGLPLISKKQVKRNPRFLLGSGWTLITRSGTIGRMVYSRPDMEGLACSEHVMRVVPDGTKIPPGYLYAFLSSKFGVPLVTSGTYGSIIQSIEPEHIAGLPVPRLGEELELSIHSLVELAARRRSEAAQLRMNAVRRVTSMMEWSHQSTASLSGIISSSNIQRRFDAFYHASGVCSARERLSAGPCKRLGDIVEEVFEPNRGPRRKVDDEEYGVPFLSSSEVFRLDPVGEYLISRSRTPQLERQIITDRDLLLPRSGQIGGIIGRAVLPLPTYYGCAASEHLVRVRCRSKEDAFFAWGIFATEPGYYAAIGTAYGSSIPSLDCALLADLQIPWWSDQRREEIVEQVSRMITALSEAIDAERRGVALLERAIQGGS